MNKNELKYARELSRAIHKLRTIQKTREKRIIENNDENLDTKYKPVTILRKKLIK